MWIFTYFGYGPTFLFVSFLNMTYFASFILYPILLGAFGVAASPYILKSKSERDIASYGQHGEDYSFFVYFGLVFVTMWVQFTLNSDLNRHLNGDPYLCDPFSEDCSAIYQAQKAAEARRRNGGDNEQEQEQEIEVAAEDEFNMNVFDF